MDLRAQLRRHRKDGRFIVGTLAALLAVFTAGFYLLQRSRDVDPSLVTNRLLLFVLAYVNVVLILTVLFVLLRNLFKLAVERHHRILGSKFRVKLVLTYVGLSLIPVLLLFFISTQLLRGAIDRWFSTPLEEILPQGSAVAEALLAEHEQATLARVLEAREAIGSIDLADPASLPDLGRRIQEQLTARELDYLAVYEGTQLVHGAVSPQSGIVAPPEPGRSLLRRAAEDGKAQRRDPGLAEGLLFLSAIGDPAGADRAGGPDLEASDEEALATAALPLIVVGGRLFEAGLANQAQNLILSNQAHRQLEVQKEEIKASYLLIFLMMTLFILLASSWVGLYLARRVTVPIQALAEGTRRISEGDLGHRVEVAADDELGVLVSSFNRMTAELATSKELLEEGNRELSTTNQRLADERALIAAVLENVAAGVISFDSGDRIFTCNGAALEMLRQSESDVLGRPVSEAWSDPERSRLAALLGGSAERPITTETRLMVGGVSKTFEVKLTAAVGAGGVGKVRVMVLEDLTELIQAQQVAAWSLAARRIAHEIKNPLTPIKLAAERLLNKFRRGDDDLEQNLEEAVEIIVREVRSMQGMVDEFSRFARMPRPRPSRVDLARLVDETLHLYRGLKAGVEVKSTIGSSLEAWVDGEQIKRALINLLDNAVEATPAPGSVTLSAERSNGHLRIDVADTGRGIPAESKEKLFLPHFSTKGRGTGLGLAIVHRIVTDHHGTIRVGDNRPRGTVISIELPIE